MQPIDYGRSMIIGIAPKNEVRFWVESRTRVIDDNTGRTADYSQCGMCKSEIMWVETGLLQPDNYDFTPIFGPEHSVVFRRKVWLNPDYKTCYDSTDLWDGQRYALVDAPGVKELTTVEEALEANFSMKPVVAQTEIVNEATGMRAIHEYPVKTLNSKREPAIVQIDTGPIALMDVSKKYERDVDGLSLAHIVFNRADHAEFVVEGPTASAPPDADASAAPQVYHYQTQVHLSVTNRLYVHD